MLNKKGQTLVMFILLLPVLIGIMALVIDVGLISYEKSKLTNVIEQSYKDNINTEDYLKKNNIKNYKIKKGNMCTSVTYYKKSMFGNIVGIREYKIKSRVCKE